MMSFCDRPFQGERKIAQIGQTELIMPIYRHYQATRRRTGVRREAKFVQNTRHSITEIRQMTNFHLNFCFIFTLQLQLKSFVKPFIRLVWCVHFATAPVTFTVIQQPDTLHYPHSATILHCSLKIPALPSGLQASESSEPLLEKHHRNSGLLQS